MFKDPSSAVKFLTHSVRHSLQEGKIRPGLNKINGNIDFFSQRNINYTLLVSSEEVQMYDLCACALLRIEPTFFALLHPQHPPYLLTKKLLS